MTTALTSYTSYMMADDENTDSGSVNETPKQQAANDARQNFLNQMNQVFEQILSDKTNIRPLTYVPAGTRIIVYPNVDLWMRTRERNPQELGGQGKKDVFIDDPQTTGKRELEKNRRSLGKTETAPTGAGSVVYESQDIDVEAAGGTPTLIDDSKPSNSGKKTNNPPPLISSPAAGVTPPPPPSFATSPTPGAATAGSNTGSSNNTNNSVPQLF